MHSPWMTQGLFNSHKTKEKLFSKRKRYPTDKNIDAFKNYNTLYNKIRRAAKKLYFEKQFTNFEHDIKNTWSVIKELLGIKKQKDQIPDFFRENGNIINNNLDISNGFNTFFSQIGPKLA